MRKSLLNNYELAVLHRGAEEERKGVSIHSYPKNETQELLNDYYAWALEGAKVDYQIVVGALKDLFQWWATYFTCGEETARAIKREYDEELMAELDKKHQETMARIMAQEEAYEKTWGGMI